MKFIDNLKIPSKFLHKDEIFEMLKTHPNKIANSNLPSIYLHKEEKLSLILASDEINQAKALKELMNIVEKSSLEHDSSQYYFFSLHQKKIRSSNKPLLEIKPKIFRL